MLIHKCDWCGRVEGQYQCLTDISIKYTEEVCNNCLMEIAKEFELIKKRLKKNHRQQGERARTSQTGDTILTDEVTKPESSLAINGDSNPADTIKDASCEVEK